MARTLGILVTSEQHGAHILDLVPVARRKKIQLRVHMTGDGVRLCLKKNYQTVLSHTQLTICRQSAQHLSIADAIETFFPGSLTSDQNPPLRIFQCLKRIVL